jgi:outer membrane protein assembly factor BamB
MNTDSTLSLPAPKRRQILRSVGSLSALGAAGVGASSTVAADLGDQQWVYDIPNGSLISIAVADRTVYASVSVSEPPNKLGYLTAVDAKTGKEQWRFDITRNDYTVGLSPPATDGDTVCVGAFGELYGIDAETGQQKWVEEIRPVNEVYPTVKNGTVFTASENFDMHAYDAETGEYIWDVDTDAEFHSKPVVADGLVYAGNSAGFHRQDGGYLYAATEESGYGVDGWVFDAGEGIVNLPAVANDTVYFSTLNHEFHAVDGENEEVEWTFEADGIFSSPTVADGTVFVGNDDNNLYALDAETGDQQWAFETGGAVHDPTVVDDTVFVASKDEKLYAIDAETGKGQSINSTDSDYSYEFRSPIVKGGTLFGASEKIVALDVGRINSESGVSGGGFELDWSESSRIPVGLGAGIGISAIGAAGYFLKRRLTDESE